MDEALAQDVPWQLIATTLWEDDVLAASSYSAQKPFGLTTSSAINWIRA
jgi:hypothetical protein